MLSPPLSNVWKHIQNAGLQVRYVEEPEFSLQLWMFLLPQDVIQGFVAFWIEIKTNFGNVADGLLVYFVDTCVGKFCLNALRNNPIFSIELWNMYHRADVELPRTNNNVEDWHCSFQGHLSSYHPSFWKFLWVLKNEELVNHWSTMKSLLYWLQCSHSQNIWQLSK